MLALFEAAVELLQKMHAFVSQEQDVQEMAMMAARVGRVRTSLPSSLALAMRASNSSLVWHAITAPSSAAIIPTLSSPLISSVWDPKLRMLTEPLS